MLSKQEQKIILKILPALNEAQSRWFVAKEALSLGRGGIQYIQDLTGYSRPTITKGIKEISSKKKLFSPGRVRVFGGGRKPIEES